MTFEEWKEKHSDLIENVAITFFYYERGVDTKTCYDELEYLLKKAFNAGKPKWHKPEETIEKNKIVLGHIKHCNKDRYSLVQWNGEWWYQYGTYNAEVRLIEWCEIPRIHGGVKIE